MAAVVGEAGGSARRRSIRLAAAVPVSVLAFALVFGIAVAVAFAHTTSPLPLAGFTVLVLGIGLAVSKDSWLELGDLVVESRHWAKGAAGERLTADDLALLPDQYLVLNDLHPAFRGPAARWNWDHVIIGPTGIFVVDAKYYSATRIKDESVDVRTQRNVRQVGGYARSFKNELLRLNRDLGGIFVVPMLAYANEGTWVEKTRQADVRVLPLRLVRNDVMNYSWTSLSATEAIKIANLLFGMYESHVQEEYRSQYQSWGRAVRASEWMTGTSSAGEEAAREPGSTGTMTCPKCDAPMLRREGAYGAFYGCSKYRETGCRGRRTVDGQAK